jgi:hypothetical protein
VGLTIQRNLGPVGHLSPRQYTRETASGDPAICCPRCSRVFELEFGVHVGGVVSQIVSCPFADCPFVDYLTLESWNEPVVPA